MLFCCCCSSWVLLLSARLSLLYVFMLTSFAFAISNFSLILMLSLPSTSIAHSAATRCRQVSWHIVLLFIILNSHFDGLFSLFLAICFFLKNLNPYTDHSSVAFSLDFSGGEKFVLFVKSLDEAEPTTKELLRDTYSSLCW